MSFKEFIENGQEHFLPNLSIDHVIIGYENGQLKCLLLQIGEKWLLPGGYIKRDESVENAALRILKERTSLENPFMKFLSVIGGADRKFTEQWKDLLPKINIDWNKNYWINDRFVTLVYYSLVDIERVTLQVGKGLESIDWFSFDELPQMWLDHSSIAMTAREQLKNDIKKEIIAYRLLPIEFTMPELHQIYQIILEEEIDRSRFQKNMLASGVFERLPQRQNESRGRNPYLYQAIL